VTMLKCIVNLPAPDVTSGREFIISHPVKRGNIYGHQKRW
jgi:hypothetical protein